MFVHVGIDGRFSVLESLMLFNDLNSLHIHTCLCIYRTYTRSGGHMCNIQLKWPKKRCKGGSNNKKRHKKIFKNIFNGRDCKYCMCCNYNRVVVNFGQGKSVRMRGKSGDFKWVVCWQPCPTLYPLIPFHLGGFKLTENGLKNPAIVKSWIIPVSKGSFI